MKTIHVKHLLQLDSIIETCVMAVSLFNPYLFTYLHENRSIFTIVYCIFTIEQTINFCDFLCILDKNDFRKNVWRKPICENLFPQILILMKTKFHSTSDKKDPSAIYNKLITVSVD